MAEDKSMFRATLFLDEHFAFLQDNVKEDDNLTTDQSKTQPYQYNVSDDKGGPTSVEDSGTSQSETSVDNSRISTSSVSSQQSDISQSMSLRTSSASMSSREGRASAVSSSQEAIIPEDMEDISTAKTECGLGECADKSSRRDQTSATHEQNLQKEHNVGVSDKTGTERGSYSSSADEEDKDRKSFNEVNAKSSLASYNSPSLTVHIESETNQKPADESSCMHINNSVTRPGDTEKVPDEDNSVTNPGDTEKFPDEDTSLPPDQSNVKSPLDLLRLSPSNKEDRGSRHSVMADGKRVSVFVKESFDFLSDEEDATTEDNDSKESPGQNLDSHLPEESEKDDKKAKDVDVQGENGVKMFKETDNSSENYLQSIEPNCTGSENESVETIDSKSDELVSDNSSNPVNTNMPGKSRKGTISMFIRDEFEFLNEIEEGTEDSDVKCNNTNTIEEFSARKISDEDGKTKTHMSHHSRNLSADVTLIDKPQSPVIERVRKSEKLHGSSSSSWSRSTSPGQSSMSSSASSDTESGEENPVFEPENSDKAKLQRAKTISEEPSTKRNPLIGAGIERSLSVSTTVSEREFRTQFREKDIVRPTKQKNSKSQSVSKFRRQTQYIPEITVVLVKSDPEQTYGFHFIKDEDNKNISPWVITTVETGGIAQANGIEVGARLVCVNGEDVLDASLPTVVKLITSDPEKVELTLCPCSTSVSQKSGYLWKQSSGLMKKFKKRWFTLKKDNCLYYYKGEKDVEPLGAICLSNYSVSKATEIDPTTFKLLKFDCKSYVLKAENVEEMTVWGGLIEQAANDKNRLYPETTTHNLTLPAIQIKNADCHGLLHKRGDSRKVWRKRYCVLKDGSLYYYKDQNAGQAKGVAHLHGYMFTSEFSHGRICGFVLSPPDIKMRTFYFGTDTQPERTKWVEAMRKSISKWKDADDTT